jgi:hypothetical protein
MNHLSVNKIKIVERIKTVLSSFCMILQVQKSVKGLKVKKQNILIFGVLNGSNLLIYN